MISQQAQTCFKILSIVAHEIVPDNLSISISAVQVREIFKCPLGWLSFHNIGPLGLCPGGARGQKLKKSSKCCICALKVSRSRYLDKHLSESIKTWTIPTL